MISLPIASQNAKGTQDAYVYIMVFLKFWADHLILMYTPSRDLVKSVGSHGSLSLLNMV
jgi:hypothetical protein